jgi:hypothetical protein
MNMAFAWLIVMLEIADVSIDDILNTFLKLGFRMKLKKVSLDQATFLKGMWYYTYDGPVWGPLVSRILKFGKSLRDPRILYKAQGVGKNLVLASRLFLHDLACGLDTFLPVPLLRTLVKNFKQFDRRILVNPEQNWLKVEGTSRSSSLHPDSWLQLEERYGILKEEFLLTERLIPKDPFCFITSPIFRVLAEIDYN